MSDLLPFEIEVAPNGNAQVVVDGKDYSKSVRAFRIESQAGYPPVVTLQQVSGGGKIEGEGIVQVGSGGSGENQQEAIVAFLNSMDAHFLEAAVLERCGFGDNATQVTLDILREWASGSQH